MALLKGYRGPALALIISILLLGAVIITRPPDETPAPSIASSPLPPTATSLPTLTPAPTIPIQQVDTSTLHEAVVGCVKKLNPLLAGYNQVDRDVDSLIFEGLFTTNTWGEPVPDIAQSWSESYDGLTYVIKLRSDVLWQDGIPFTSADVMFTIGLMQDEAFPGPTDLHNFWRTVDVDALDEHTIRLKLAQPLAAFLDYLRIGMLPEHVLKGTPASALSAHPFNLMPVGTGPYQFDRLTGNGGQPTGVRLRVAATYLQRPEGKDGYALREIVFHCEPSLNDAIAAFQRGEVNTISELTADTLRETAALPLLPYQANRPAFGAVIYNWQRPEVGFFRDFRMRQALARSVDRNALVNKYMAGRAVSADSPILPDSWAYDSSVSCPSFNLNNPDAAKTALAQVQIKPTPAADTNQGAATEAATAPASDPPDDPATAAAPSDYHFQLLVNNDPALAGMANEIVNAWRALGLHADVIVVDTSTFKERLVAGTFDSALVELNLAPNADPDPYSLWRQIPADGGLNFGGMNERVLSELIEQARREVNGIHRTELYHEFQRLFCDRASALLLYYPIYTYGADIRLAGIQLGFMSDPSDRFRTIQNWRFAPPSS